MEFLLGLLTAVVFFICLFIAFKIGQKQTKTIKKDNPLTEEDQRQREKIKQFDQHFKSLFAYDVEKALQRKKVT